MSRINDALKQARKTPPRNLPNALQPMPPVAEESSPVLVWLLPAFLIVLVVAAIFFIGWAVAHHSVHTIVNTPPPESAPPVAAAAAPLPEVKPAPVAPAPPVNPPAAPKLQGIFYSTTAPSAIIDGQTVKPGDQFRQYQVKAITKYSVTLVGPDKKEIQIGMSN